jgi:hypothetical protein
VFLVDVFLFTLRAVFNVLYEFRFSCVSWRTHAAFVCRASIFFSARRSKKRKWRTYSSMQWNTGLRKYFLNLKLIRQCEEIPLCFIFRCVRQSSCLTFISDCLQIVAATTRLKMYSLYQSTRSLHVCSLHKLFFRVLKIYFIEKL